MNIELANFLKRVSDDIGNQDARVTKDYSGRGMMGRTTAGIVVDSPQQLLIDVLQWVSGNISMPGAAREDAVWLGGEIPDLSNLQIDNMGRSIILY